MLQAHTHAYFLEEHFVFHSDYIKQSRGSDLDKIYLRLLELQSVAPKLRMYND
jgi:hypothetical protein